METPTGGVHLQSALLTYKARCARGRTVADHTKGNKPTHLKDEFQGRTYREMAELTEASRPETPDPRQRLQVPVMNQDKVIERQSGQIQRTIKDNKEMYVINVYLKLM
jgi:hypothetical protein